MYEYSVTANIILGIMIMKKVFRTNLSLKRASGLKLHALALAVCAGLSLSTIESAEAAPSRNVNPPALKANAPNVYVVKKGDTLWHIAGRFLKKPTRWPEIWSGNRHVKNPHWIFPGDRLLLCDWNGRPLIGKDEGDGCEGLIRRAGGQGATLSPQIRVEALNNTIPVIPLEDIKHWLERSIVINADSIAHTPYIVGAADTRVLAAKGQISYVRGNGLTIGERYAVYRQADPYLLPDGNGNTYNAGVELFQVASGVVVNQENDITSLRLTDSYNGEVRRGDLVLPEYDPMLPTLFYPTIDKEVVAGGKVVRVLGSIGAAAVNSVVTLDRGTTHGAKSGQVFNVYQKGEVTQDPKTQETITLPGERVGTVMIFKTFDHISYAYVLESELPIKLGAELRPPVLDE